MVGPGCSGSTNSTSLDSGMFKWILAANDQCVSCNSSRRHTALLKGGEVKLVFPNVPSKNGRLVLASKGLDGGVGAVAFYLHVRRVSER